MSEFAEKPCSVFNSSLHGTGVIATSTIPSGNILFEEKPLLCLQSIPNRRDVIVCSYCFEFLGSNELQSSILKRECTRQSNLSEIIKSTPEPLRFSDIVPCRDNCGEYYCSELCQMRHWNSSHKLLCTGSIPDDKADDSILFNFKVHACQVNEIFLLVADVFAQIVLRIESILSQDPPVKTREEAIQEALSPFEGYVRELWWDAAQPPSPSSPTKQQQQQQEKQTKKSIEQQKKELKKQKKIAEEFKNTLERISFESYELLSDVLQLNEKGLVEILSFEYFSRTIGMFEQNNVGVRLSNPLAVALSQLTPKDKEAVLKYKQIVQTILEKLEEEEGDDCSEYEDLDEEEEEEEGEGEEGEVSGKDLAVKEEEVNRQQERASNENEEGKDEGVEGDGIDLVSQVASLTLLPSEQQQQDEEGEEEGLGEVDLAQKKEWNELHDLIQQAGEESEGDDRVEEKENEKENENVSQTALHTPSSSSSEWSGRGLERVFPPLDGTAFYSLICRINHSCEPNVLVIYSSQHVQSPLLSSSESPSSATYERKGKEIGLVAQLIALRDIQEGEELVQSYVDQQLDYVERAKALKEYGFACRCRKCELQL